jgi:hypothetical protein
MTRIICHFVMWVCTVGKVGHIHMEPELTWSSYQHLADTVVTLCMQMPCLCLQPQAYELYSILSPNCVAVNSIQELSQSFWMRFESSFVDFHLIVSVNFHFLITMFPYTFSCCLFWYWQCRQSYLGKDWVLLLPESNNSTLLHCCLSLINPEQHICHGVPNKHRVSGHCSWLVWCCNKDPT